MNRKELKNILNSMENNQNRDAIIMLLGKIDMLPDEKIEDITKQYNSKQIKEIIKGKIEETQSAQNISSDKTKVNDFIEYGISENCVHLHLPGDFHAMFKKMGNVKASATIGNYLVDAINKINQKRNDGEKMLEQCFGIYMISPIFYAPAFYPRKLRENNKIKIKPPILKLFELMGAETHGYTTEELNREGFLETNSEAALAGKIFGKNKDIGTASISFDKINSRKFQRKLNKVSKFLDKFTEPVREDIQL